MNKGFYVAVLVGALGAGVVVANDGAQPVSATTVSATTVSVTTVSVTGVVSASPVMKTLTAADAEAAYQQSREHFKAVAAGAASAKALLPNREFEIAVFSDPDKEFHPGTPNPENLSIEDVDLVIDVEDMSLRDVINRVVSQAAERTGMWTVKWRLKPENRNLPDERVNLTAESKFGEFVDLLAERVRNMSGTQLYMTAYNDARVILITDTYY